MAVEVKKRTVKKRQSQLIVKRGDVFWADLAQTIGSEQSGIRPVVVIQNDVGNKYSPTVIIACITSNIQKAHLPTHVEVGRKHGLEKKSVILGEQIRTIDKKRLLDRITHFDAETMAKVDKAMLVSLGIGVDL